MSEALELRRDSKSAPLFGSLAAFAMGSIGSKMVMAATGIGLWLFITAHLVGNLTVYLGRDTFNHYAATLQHTPALLWFIRVCLIVGIPLHFLTAIRTTMINRGARPVPYAFESRAPASLAAKQMALSGMLVLAFFALHLAHFTRHVVGGEPPPPLADGGFDAYTMLVRGFQQPIFALIYIVAQILLAAHLSHGLYSMFQHLGLWGRRWTPWLKGASVAVAYGTCAAFASIPLAVLLEMIRP
jgi:succinate dehydrogenase / fumarate reductase cytochrome b subunit